MKKDSRNVYSFWFSLIALATSIIALCVFIFKVEPNSIVTIDTFIGVMATFIGILVTILVGYQIYNVFDMRRKLQEFKDLQETLNVQKNELKSLESRHNEGIYILQARLCYGDVEQKVEAFLKMHTAIQYSLSANHKEDGYKWLLDELYQYMIGVDSTTIFGGPSQCRKAVERLKELYRNNDSAIRNHENYLYIKDRYEELMTKFEKRLDLISACKIVSIEELDKEQGK